MNTVKIGWGRREISTMEPVSLPGQMYMRVSKGVHDPCYATALVVDGGAGQDAVAFCSCDIVALANGVVKAVSERVHALRPEISADAVIMNATHTHAGAQNAETPEFSPGGEPIYPGLKYREFFIEQCSNAIVEAWDRRQEGGIAYGYGYAVVAHSRRVIYFDDTSLRNPNPVAPNGHGVMYGDTNDDQFASYEAGADHFLNLMFTFDAAQKLTGIVINVPCPSQLSEHFNRMSSDFWNEVRELVAKEYGEDVYILTQCAAAGDLSPRVLHYNHAQSRRFLLKYGLKADPFNFDDVEQEECYNKVICERRDIAERIMESVREVYSWAKNDIQSEVAVRHERRTMKLSRRMITEEEKKWCEDTIEVMKANLPDEKTGTPEEIRKAVTFYESVKGRNERAIARFEEQKAEPWRETVVHAVRIGEIAFATNHYELYMDFMHRMQARSPFIQTFIVQLAGTETGGGYLCTERAAANKGYSASLFCNQVSPEGGQELVENTLEMLRGLAD